MIISTIIIVSRYYPYNCNVAKGRHGYINLLQLRGVVGLSSQTTKKGIEDLGVKESESESVLSDKRKLDGYTGTIVRIIAIGLAAFLVYIQMFKAMEPIPLRSITMAVTAVLAFFYYPGWEGAKKRISILDIALALMSVAVLVYILVEQKTIIYRAGVVPTKPDILFGIMMIIVVLEMARRTTGPILSGFAVICIIYALWGSGLPGLLSHVGYSYKRVVSFVFGLDGVYGVTLGVVPSYVFVFILFGSFLQECGGTDMIIDLARALTGRARGGPAKMAVVASSLMGTISGSTVSNVVTTGSITIPLMKRVGYNPAFAAAVETAASSGGQILPPVMGASAFIMAELLGISYLDIAKAAVIPAILYYISIYWFIDLEAQKCNLKGLESSEVPNVISVLKTRGHLIIPILALVFIMVVLKMSPIMAALMATLSCIVVSWFKKDTRIGIKGVLNALQQTSEGLMTVTAACSVAGLIIGILGLTGLGVKLGIGLLTYTKGNIFFTLFFTMILAILLGMGQPSISAYIVGAAVAAPSIMELGVEPLVAHLFVFYFASFSNVTPPVAVASYVAAGLAKANPLSVAGLGLKLCIVAFIVPYMFIIAPGLIMQGSFSTIVFSLLSSMMGVYALCAALQGWLVNRLKVWQRIALLAVAGLGLHPGSLTDIVALALFVCIFLINKRENKAVKALN